MRGKTLTNELAKQKRNFKSGLARGPSAFEPNLILKCMRIRAECGVVFTQTWYLRRRGNSGICRRCRGPSRRSEREDCQIGLSGDRSSAFAPNHNGRSCIEAHDVPLHLVHPHRVEGLREAVDDDHQLPHRRVRAQSGEARVRRGIGQVRRLDLATVEERGEIILGLTYI